eukprot:TRINITY_DN8610_c0_g4_i7.p1 TRINITY_DN8610_c0_g4~~TRINITY_DN8610_c0_g4_i7.p1  ORF type:complete len:188 (+),score=35.14 TRINITY_DN8610_c0_g4_i7:230-793(+)
MHLKGKYPLKHATEIKDMLNSKISSSILEEEAIDIVRYMYNKDDAAYIIERLQPNLGYAKGPADTLKRGVKEDPNGEKFRIEYALFQKVILDFQMRSHDLFLRNFLSYFKGVDRENRGILDEENFRELIEILNHAGYDLDADTLLRKLDPHNFDVITFSSCISLFAAEQVSSDSNMSILQKISLESN